MNHIENTTNLKYAPPNAGGRNNADLIRRRISLLDGKDKLLMSMYFKNGNSCYQIARLLGVCDATITRRIRKLTYYLLDEPFHKYRIYRKLFDSLQKDIARDHFLMGLSIQQIANKRSLSLYKVRTALKEIKLIIKSKQKPPPKINPSPSKSNRNHKNRRLKANYDNVQHIKKFQMAGNNNRPRGIRLSYVRSDYRKASGI
jgi:predicted DNA-binding protein YlxM (UPF0122 family)